MSKPVEIKEEGGEKESDLAKRDATVQKCLCCFFAPCRCVAGLKKKREQESVCE